MKRSLSLFLAALMALSACLVLAEEQSAPHGHAQVQTPGGSLNQREEPSTKSPLVQRIPNHATVTLSGEPGEKWTCVIYKGKTGYVQTVYLNLAKTAEGKTIYADGSGMLYLRDKPSDNGKIVSILDGFCALNVLSVEGDWAKITSTTADGVTHEGYVHVSRILTQREQPLGYTTADHLNEAATLRKKQPLYSAPSTEASVLVTLPKKHTVTVLAVEGGWCRVQADSALRGYLPVSSVVLTGKKAESVDYLEQYTAVYYTCTVPGGILSLYPKPGSTDVTSWVVAADEVIPVLLRGTDFEGVSWSKVTYQGGSYWTPTADLAISDKPNTMYYPDPIRQTTAGVIFAGENGTTMYANGSRFSEKVGFIPAGTEVQGFLGAEWIIVTYDGVTGTVFYDEIITGLAEVENGDWYYWQHLDDPAPTVTPDPALAEANHVSRDAARKAADEGLSAAVAGFSAKGLDVRSDKCLRGGVTVYEFAYFKGGKYLYAASVDAVTGECISTADYTAFAQTVSHAAEKPAEATERPGEISKSKARSVADSALSASYGSFSGDYMVVNEYFESVPNYDEPVYRLNYYHGDEHCFTCFVGAKSGKALYHTDVWSGANTEIDYATPTPEPVYESTTDIGESAARAIAERTLSGKYPEFSSQTFSSVSASFHEETGSFEKPYYQFDYFIDGRLAYEIMVHAWTGKVLYTFGSLPGEGNG